MVLVFLERLLVVLGVVLVVLEMVLLVLGAVLVVLEILLVVLGEGRRPPRVGPGRDSGQGMREEDH